LLVVIADKDPHDLEALRAAFEAPDCEVVAAFDGTVALKLARERSPDAAVLSSSLGQLGGLACSREIKTSVQLGEIPDPKIVVLFEREADTWLAAWSRCDAWLVKPVNPLDVADVMRELLAPQPASA
jgi:DNA-binding response OmpR family regulator